jgi:hypothetical protein
MVTYFSGKSSQVSYARLRLVINHFMFLDGYNEHNYFATKDELRAFLNDAFDTSDYTLLSTAKGVFVATNHYEVVECAERLKRHALGELKRYSQLMKMPKTMQVVVDFESDELRLIDSYTWQHLQELDKTLLEISKEREENV